MFNFIFIKLLGQSLPLLRRVPTQQQGELLQKVQKVLKKTIEISSVESKVANDERKGMNSINSVNQPEMIPKKQNLPNGNLKGKSLKRISLESVMRSQMERGRKKIIQPKTVLKPSLDPIFFHKNWNRRDLYLRIQEIISESTK